MHIQMLSRGSIFGTRPMAHAVFDEIQADSEQIILDFSGVKMASSSFLHETLMIFHEKSSEVKMKNMTAAIELQLAKAKNAL